MRYLNRGWQSGHPDSNAPSGFRVYRTHADRKRAIGNLRRRGYNYFTEYRDVEGPALSFARTRYNPNTGYNDLVETDGTVRVGRQVNERLPMCPIVGAGPIYAMQRCTWVDGHTLPHRFGELDDLGRFIERGL
jgi:hypothetical protein